MNRAMAMADTPWVKLFCHDDQMRADCLEQLLALIGKIGNRQVGIIGNRDRALFDNGHLSDELPAGPPVIMPGHEALRRRFSGAAGSVPIPAVTNATVCRKSFYEQGGFDERFVHFDIFCWLEMLMNRDYAYLHDQLTITRIHTGQVAAGARVSLRSVDDYRLFMPDFIERHGKKLQLGPGARLRARLLPIGVAATTLAIEIMAGRWRRARNMIARLPARWLLPLLPLTIRALIAEACRTRTLRGKVPIEQLYP
jgi:hypothetical protein